MKKLLICILGLFLIGAASFHASAWWNVVVVGGGVPVSDVPLSRTNRLGEHKNDTATADPVESSSFTASDNSLIIVCLTGYRRSGAEGDVAGGLSLTSSIGTPEKLEETIDSTAANSYGIAFFKIPITTGGSMTVTADCGAFVLSYLFFVVEYTGYNVASPTGATATGYWTSGDGAKEITLSSNPASTSQVLASVAVSYDTGTGTVTPGTGWTEIYDVGINNWHNSQLQVRTSSTSTAVNWDDISASGTPNASSVAIAIEIKD